MLEEELVEALEIEDYEWAERVRLEIERIKDENSDKSK
jgi:protein-arginine kinase activator protein McsA